MAVTRQFDAVDEDWTGVANTPRFTISWQRHAQPEEQPCRSTVWVRRTASLSQMCQQRPWDCLPHQDPATSGCELADG